MLFEKLEDTARILQLRVEFDQTPIVKLILPFGAVVMACYRVIAAEETVRKFVALLNQERSVSIVAHVFVLDLVMSKQVINHPAEEGDISASAQRHINVGHRGSTGESRINHHQPRLVLRLGFDHPLEADRMSFGRIAAHHQNDIGILDVDPVVSHRAATKGGGQTGHRWSVSEAGLIVEADDAERAYHFVGRVTSLVGGCGGGQKGDRFKAVDGLSLAVPGDKAAVALV